MNLLENQQLAESVDGVYTDLEAMLMRNIIRHIKDYDQPIATDEWLLQKLAEIGKLNKENMKIIAQQAGISQTAAERMLQDAAEESIKSTDAGFRYLVRQGLADEAVESGQSKSVRQVMKTLRDQAKDTLNVCNTTMLYKARDAFKKLVRTIASDAGEIAEKQSFLDILGKHATATTIGAESRQQAVRKCIQEFNDKGIPAFVDRAGREWTPEAYVNMAMRNTARQTAEETQSARCLDFGVNLIAIDSHSGARPKCARDQGKIFDLNNGSGYTKDVYGKRIRYYAWKDSSYGEPDGILGINCGHHKWPFVPGVSIQRYFPTEDMDANDTLYKETQVQRALERDVRKQKRECMLFDELGDRDAFEKAAVKLKQKESKLKTYVDSKDHLHRRSDREQVVGFGKRVSAEATVADRRVKKRLEEKVRDDKIKTEIKATGMKGQIELSPKEKIDVSDFAFDDAHINGERDHRVTRDDAIRFVQEADVSITRWNGRFVNYYGPNGAVFVDTENNNIRTAFQKEEFDDRVKKMREVIRNNGKD
ncbi:MAG TPA: phage minor capsid protein [Candidatus Mediterraneibacter excrementigallinarum]|nr:phage minor capsid protein [Candidatus Mediterraneibacter excrementigallinarum]